MHGRLIRSFTLGIGLVGLATATALAASVPDTGRIQMPPYPGAPKPVAETPPPYPMSYIDEAAQTLGVKNGRLDLFSSHPAENNVFMPVISGSVSSKGAMLRLQWHPGE